MINRVERPHVAIFAGTRLEFFDTWTEAVRKAS